MRTRGISFTDTSSIRQVGVNKDAPVDLTGCLKLA
jgi:hypothetical protein